MLCYAWNILAIKDDIKLGDDDFDDAYNLLGRIFSYGLGKLIRSGFHRSYIEQTDELSTVRGKINIQETINASSLQRKKLVCSYDEYSKDDVFNRILKYNYEKIDDICNINCNICNKLSTEILYNVGTESIRFPFAFYEYW